MAAFSFFFQERKMMKDIKGDWVVAGDLMCAPTPVPMGMLKDINAALLFSQLTADDKYPNRRSSSEWLTEYTKALKALKWTGTGFDSQSFEVDDESVVTIASTVERLLLAGAGAEHADHVRQALACLGELPDMQAQTMFRKFTLVCPLPSELERHASAMETDVALMITVLKPDKVVVCLWMTFTTVAQLSNDFLHQPFTGAQLKGPFVVRLSQRQWNAAGYATVRARVERYLAGRQKDLIMPLECPDELSQG